MTNPVSTMREYSAGYANTCNNFVVSNLKQQADTTIELRRIAETIQQILSRGWIVPPSARLQAELGVSFDSLKNRQYFPLLCRDSIVWNLTIKGNSRGFVPAFEFYHDILPSFLPDRYKFLRQLVWPEAELEKIAPSEDRSFVNQSVDFYIPVAQLVIEIDGSQHNATHQKQLDKQRDWHLRNSGIDVLRIPVVDFGDPVKMNHCMESIVARYVNITKAIEASELENCCKPEYSSSGYCPQELDKVAQEECVECNLTVIVRMQIVLLEMIRLGYFESGIEIAVRRNNYDYTPLFETARNDLEELWHNVSIATGLEQPFPTIKVDHNSSEVQRNTVEIDIDIFRRFGEQAIDTTTIYCRTHYIEGIRIKARAQSLTFVESTLSNFKTLLPSLVGHTGLNTLEQTSFSQSLWYLAFNLFLYDVPELDQETPRFRNGQLEIIANSIGRQNTIGLLPTGAGKSLCAWLVAVLQPGPVFIVSPIVSLMDDQINELYKVGFTNVTKIDSTLTPEGKEAATRRILNGGYKLVYVTPERFQDLSFATMYKDLTASSQIPLVVVDEAHCMSEWGHDFRPAYLSLYDTIVGDNSVESQRVPKILGLTATASLNVLKDLQIQLHVHDENTIYPMSFSRKELQFHVVNAYGKRVEKLKQLLQRVSEVEQDSSEGGSVGCIVFCPTVNGKDNGVEPLSKYMSQILNEEVSIFYGGRTTDKQSKESQVLEKSQHQKDFKNNKTRFMFCTKAFGMGINKGNVGYTIHIGVPGSMEALYQEAGRAGRDSRLFDNRPAHCTVIFSPANSNSRELSRIFNESLDFKELFELTGSSCFRGSDLSTQFYFLVDPDIDPEFEVSRTIDILEDLRDCAMSQRSDVFDWTASNSEGNSKIVDKSLVRLLRLGLIRDVKVKKWASNKHYRICLNKVDKGAIADNLSRLISKYDQEASVPEPSSENFDLEQYTYTVIDYFINWSFQYHFYSRLESLKTVYQQCQSVLTRDITEDQFKANLEAYFTFTPAISELQRVVDEPKDLSVTIEYFKSIGLIVEHTQSGSRLPNSNLQEESLRVRRFIESYRNNTALILIDDVLNSVVKNDISKSSQLVKNTLKNLSSLEDDEYVVKAGQIICDVLRFNSNIQESVIADTLLTNIDRSEMAKFLVETLNHERSTLYILKQVTQKLRVVNDEFTKYIV